MKANLTKTFELSLTENELNTIYCSLIACYNLSNIDLDWKSALGDKFNKSQCEVLVSQLRSFYNLNKISLKDEK